MIRHHPTEVELADFLDNRLPGINRSDVITHIASCDECLKSVLSAYETVKSFKRKDNHMKVKIDFYLLLALISFALSFLIPSHFIQLLVATLILGAKWVLDSRATKMLVMIHEAWKQDGGRGASDIIKTFDRNSGILR